MKDIPVPTTITSYDMWQAYALGIATVLFIMGINTFCGWSTVRDYEQSFAKIMKYDKIIRHTRLVKGVYVTLNGSGDIVSYMIDRHGNIYGREKFMNINNPPKKKEKGKL